MKKIALLVSALLVVFLGSSAWGASISGTVTNSTGKTGRIYLRINQQYGGPMNLGTSIPDPGSAGGSFTINGVQTGVQYFVQAFVDTQGNGTQHANDPAGTSVTVTAGTGNASVGSFSVTKPATVTAQTTQAMVYPGTGANFLLWDPPTDGNGNPIADTYTVSWSATNGGTVLGSVTAAASSEKNFFAHRGAPSTYWYRLSATGGGVTVSSAWTQGTPSSATGSVSGKVYFPGLTPTGPLFVACVHDNLNGPPSVYIGAVGSPASGGSYTVNNVPPGKYSLYPILDMNNNGVYDAGDLMIDNDWSPTVVVGSGAASAPDLTFQNVNALAQVGTSHGKYGSSEWYNLMFRVQSMKKQVVKVQLVGGPQLGVVTDLALQDGKFESWHNVSRPTVGDTYQVSVSYADGSEVLTPAVTGVMDSFPVPLGPVGNIPYNPTPTFSWSAPNPAPAGAYQYELWVNQASSTSGSVWDSWEIPSGTTSLVYGSQGDVYQETLTDGVQYYWSISVMDSNGNMAQNQASFITTNSPQIGGFAPVGGLAGTSVTISGINLSTNPGDYLVLFNGVPATVTAATATSVTAVVPNGATTGPIQVNLNGKSLITTQDFLVSAALRLSGALRTTGGVAIAGARVENANNASQYTTTGADGSFTLDPVFADQSIFLKITKAGFVPTYSQNFYLQENTDLSALPFHLYTQTEVSSWGVSAGKGAMVGIVVNQATQPYQPVAGVVVTGQSMQQGTFYPVTYYNGSTLGGAATFANGVFLIPNVNDQDWVALNAVKDPWYFWGTGTMVHADSVSEVAILASLPAPYAYAMSPYAGNAGTSVTINGGNFSSTPADNQVTFNGVAATVTAASSNQLTVTVPAGASSGTVSISTAGGTTQAGYFTRQYTLTVSVTATGGAQGTVTSAPSGISCRNGSCGYDFDQGSWVSLFATADAGGNFGTWGGACSGPDSCSFTMSGPLSVTASFSANPATVHIDGNSTPYYQVGSTLGLVTLPGQTVRAQDKVFTENVVMASPVEIFFRGGFTDSLFSIRSTSSRTVVDGSIKVRQGALRVERLSVR